MRTSVQEGQEYWSKRLHKRVTVIKTSDNYAYVLDDDDNSYSVPTSDLQPLDWNFNQIMEREG